MIAFFYEVKAKISQLSPSIFKRLFLKINALAARLSAKFCYRISPCRTIIGENKDLDNPEIIVSLTTYDKRVRDTWLSIESIFRQTHLPNKLIIWIAEKDSAAQKILSDSMSKYQKRGLEIRTCKEDIMAHKKYYYCRLAFPNSLIITIDDDILYHERMIEMLLASHYNHRNHIICMRAHEITFSNGIIEPYSKWKKCITTSTSSEQSPIFFTSGGGTLFPPHSLPEEAFNIDNIKELSLYADDVWLNCMARLKGTHILKAEHSPNDVLTIKDDKHGLAAVNVNEKMNDIQLKNIMSKYRRIIYWEKHNEDDI